MMFSHKGILITVFALLLLGIGLYLSLGRLEADQEIVLREATYDSVFVELRMIAKYVEFSGDSLAGKRLTDQVWDRYRISKEEFMKAQQYYEANAKGQASRLGRLADSLSALELRINRPAQ